MSTNKSLFHPMYRIAENIKGGVLGREYIYCIETDKYYVYEYDYWQAIHELKLMKTITEEIPEINKETPAMKSQVMNHLRLMILKDIDVFNSSKMLNFPEGEFNPIDQKLYPHNKEHYSTIRMPFNYNSEAKCPLWLKTLNEIFENDERKVFLLQEFFGYCLVPDTSMKKALLIIGESNTGKSTILFILKALMGVDNCSNVALKFINHPQYTPNMINKLVNIDSDVSKNAIDYEEDFKKITSGEEITCNQKYIEAFEFIPYCRIVLAANKFPRITDHSMAMYNRLLLIPCTREFKEHEMDRELVPKIKEELPGVFNWCVEGLMRLRNKRYFENYDFMAEALQDLKDESNPVEIFFREFIEIDVSGGYEIYKDELYNRYKKWCVDNGNAPMAKNKFGSTVYDKYSKYTPKNTMSHTHMKRIWKNLKYITEKLTGEPVDYQE